MAVLSSAAEVAAGCWCILLTAELALRRRAATTRRRSSACIWDDDPTVVPPAARPAAFTDALPAHGVPEAAGVAPSSGRTGGCRSVTDSQSERKSAEKGEW